MKIGKITFNFSQLWNSEYPLVVERVLNIVAKHNPQELALDKAYKRLEALRPELEKIQALAKSSSITDAITDADRLRNRIIRAIIKIVQTFHQLNIEPYATDAKTLHLWLAKFGKNFLKENHTAQTEKTNQIITEMQADAALQKASQALHLTDLFAQLKKTNEEFETLFRTRNADFAQLPEADSKEIRLQIDKEIKRLFVAVDFCSNEYEDKNYAPLISELTELLTYHKAQVKTRKTKKAGKNQSAQAKNSAT